MSLTPQQMAVLAAVEDMTEPCGPPIRELMKRLGYTSTATVSHHLIRLGKRGLVEDRGHRQGWTLTPAGHALLSDDKP